MKPRVELEEVQDGIAISGLVLGEPILVPCEMVDIVKNINDNNGFYPYHLYYLHDQGTHQVWFVDDWG